MNKIKTCKVYLEYGYLTIRTKKGALLYSQKISDIGDYVGIEIKEIIKTVKTSLTQLGEHYE